MPVPIDGAGAARQKEQWELVGLASAPVATPMHRQVATIKNFMLCPPTINPTNPLRNRPDRTQLEVITFL